MKPLLLAICVALVALSAAPLSSAASSLEWGGTAFSEGATLRLCADQEPDGNITVNRPDGTNESKAPDSGGCIALAMDESGTWLFTWSVSSTTQEVSVIVQEAPEEVDWGFWAATLIWGAVVFFGLWTSSIMIGLAGTFGILANLVPAIPFGNGFPTLLLFVGLWAYYWAAQARSEQA